MKKVISVLLAVLLLLTFASCGEAEKTEKNRTKPKVTAGREVYQGEWIDKTDIEPTDEQIFEDIYITEIYADCFFASTVIPLPYEIKLNAELSDEWCVNDQVICTYENVYYDEETNRIEADMLSISKSDLKLDPDVCYKPVIYLYPEKKTDVNVKLDIDGKMLCTYPTYNGGWEVTAYPDGTLSDGVQTFDYLFWEAEIGAKYDFSSGFCVKGGETKEFLKNALAGLGLKPKEADEFIGFWLPKMSGNAYNVISFQKEAYTDSARLDITPAPDSLIRVFMAWYPSGEYVSLPAQSLTAPAREGFAVVEWGGALGKK